MKNDILREAYDGSYYTISGAGGNLQDWKDGYQNLLNEEGIGKVSKWAEFTGQDVNNEFNLTDDNKYPDNFQFLAFPLDGLDIPKLAMFKIKMRDRWFDDIIDNLIYR